MKILGELSSANPTDEKKKSELLMIEPTAYDVLYSINSHMVDSNGELNKVDKPKAFKQWRDLRFAFEEHGIKVQTLTSHESLPDIVFCANQSFPLRDGRVILSNMKSSEREPEVEIVKRWYLDHGYRDFIKLSHTFEGMGDVLWHPNRDFLWAGYGQRTSEDSLREISEKLNLPIVTIPLENDSFYHLDTCFSLLDSETLAYYPGAFNQKTIGFFEEFFNRTIKIGHREAKENFAGNCFCPDQSHVFVQSGSKQFEADLLELGFHPIPLETSEYIKGGGSVFCMKLTLNP